MRRTRPNLRIATRGRVRSEALAAAIRLHTRTRQAWAEPSNNSLRHVFTKRSQKAAQFTPYTSASRAPRTARRSCEDAQLRAPLSALLYSKQKHNLLLACFKMIAFCRRTAVRLAELIRVWLQRALICLPGRILTRLRLAFL